MICNFLGFEVNYSVHLFLQWKWYFQCLYNFELYSIPSHFPRFTFSILFLHHSISYVIFIVDLEVKIYYLIFVLICHFDLNFIIVILMIQQFKIIHPQIKPLFFLLPADPALHGAQNRFPFKHLYSLLLYLYLPFRHSIALVLTFRFMCHDFSELLFI